MDTTLQPTSASTAHPIDLTIFILFLLVTLVVGLSYGRSVKTLKDYALGGKNFATGTLVATFIATFFGGGSLFYTLEKTYCNGLYHILGSLGFAFGLIISGRLVLRMGDFLNNVSIAEAMGDMYGKAAQIITAVSGILARTGGMAIQFKVMAKILAMLFGIESKGASWVAACIVIFYSAFGGIKAVTFTDVIQFFTFGTVIPVLGLVIWNNLQESTEVISTLAANPKFDIREVMRWTPQFRTMASFFIFAAIPKICSPELFQRVAMARDVRQAKKSLDYSFGIVLLIISLLSWVGVLLLADNPGIEPSQVVTCMINRYAYTGLRGLIGIGVTALAMSTADSMLNASSVMFSNDVFRPLTGQSTSSIWVAKCFSIVAGILALLPALYVDDLLKLLLLGGSLYIPIFVVPMLAAVMGFRTSTRAVLMSMAAGFITMVVWSMLYGNASSVIPAVTVNLITLFGVHYLLGEPGGWQKVAPDSPLGLERAARRKAWQRQIEAIKNFRIYPYLKQNLPDQEIFYFFFGLYTIAATYISLYTIGKTEIKAYQDIYQGIGHVTLFVTTAFLTFPVWPLTVKSERFITFFWPLGMGAVLFFAGTLLLILSGFHTLQVMVLTVNLLIAVLLLRWPLAFLLASLGIAAAVCFFKQYTGMSLPLAGYSLHFSFLYGMLLLASLLIALFRGKQNNTMLKKYNEYLKLEQAASTEELVAALSYRGNLAQEVSSNKIKALAEVGQMRQDLEKKLNDAQTKEEIIAVKKDLKATGDKLQVLVDYLSQVAQQARDYMRLEVGTISLQDLLYNFSETLEQQGVASYSQVCVRNNATHKEIQADGEKVRQMLVDSCRYAKQQIQENNKPVLLGIADTTLSYPITSIQGHVKEVEALCFVITTNNKLPSTRALYRGNINSTDILIPRSATELLATHSQQIVDAHYGFYELIKNEHEVTQFCVIPVKVREVRPKVMDFLPPEATEVDKTIYPQEAAFVEDVKNRTSIDQATLSKAMDVVKKYHAGVKRKSGEPFYLHPVTTAHILLDYTQDQDTIIAALLHDVVEDTRLSLTQVELIFNKKVRKIVDGVTHLDSNLKDMKRVQLSNYENIQQLLEVEDERVLYVKLADRLHNMRTIEGHSSLDKQKKIAEETLQFFIPVAKSLGLEPIVGELKKLCSAVLTKKK